MARQKENKRLTPVRLGVDAWTAVTAMREALGDLRGVDAGKVTVTETVELLLTQNFEAVKALAENPEELPEADGGVIDVPQQFWDGLHDCRNRLSHSQSSLYTIMKKLNVGDAVTQQEISTAHALMKKLRAGASVDQKEISDAYAVTEKLDAGDAITKQHVAGAAKDVKASKDAVDEMRQMMVDYVEAQAA